MLTSGPLVIAPSDEALAIVTQMIGERTGLWQITPQRVSMLRKYSGKFSGRPGDAIDEMLASAARGDRFWKATVEAYLALNQIRAGSCEIDRETLERLIADVAACAKRDGVAHREWVKKVLDALTRLSSER